jgi:hypothetical protein
MFTGVNKGVAPSQTGHATRHMLISEPAGAAVPIPGKRPQNHVRRL